MRYEFVGRKTNEVGKTLWEIVGNLKNFGVGRLIKLSIFSAFEEPCFYKVLKVVPKPLPKNQFQNREVVMWVEEVYRGLRQPPSVHTQFTDHTRYQLIPKSSEAELYRKVNEIENNFKPRAIGKYIPCPPLYKKIWEISHERENKVFKPMPKVNTIINKAAIPRIVATKEEELPKLQCSLYKKDIPVAEKMKEIVYYKKLLKSKEAKGAVSENKLEN